MYSYNGKEYTINGICEMIGISKPTFYRRLNKGWSIDKIVNTKSWVQHGMTGTKLCKIYYDMRSRCYNPHNNLYIVVIFVLRKLSYL